MFLIADHSLDELLVIKKVACKLSGKNKIRNFMEIPKDAFQKNPDGSYSVIKSVTFKGPAGTIALNPGMSFRQGVVFMGIDIAKVLDEK